MRRTHHPEESPLRRITVSLVLVGLLLLGSGCAHQAGGIAPSTIPLSPGGYTVIEDVVGQDCVYYLLGILPLSNGNETHTAVEDALASAAGADALVGVTADTYSQNFIIITRGCTQVYGTAVSVP